MSRYIDVDELKELYEGCEDLNVKCAVVLQNIDDMPTADVVEVVRCKDCIFYFEGFTAKPTCRLQDKFMVVEANHYCSYGKKVE